MRSDSQADFSARRQEWLNGEKARYSRDNNPRYRSKYADLPSSEKDPFGDADEAQTSRYRQMLQSAQPVQPAQEPQSWQEAQRSWRQERQQEQRQWEQQQAQQQREQQQWEQQWERQWEQPQAGQRQPQRRQQRSYTEDQPGEARQRPYADDQERVRRYPQEGSQPRSQQQDLQGLDQYAYEQDLDQYAYRQQDLDQQRPDRQDQQRTRRQSQQQDRQRARRQPKQQDRGEDRRQRRSRQRQRPYPEEQVQEQPPRQRPYPEEQVQERSYQPDQRRPYPEEQKQQRPYPEEQVQERSYQPEQTRVQPQQQRPYPEGRPRQRPARQRQDQRQRRTYQQDRQQSQRRQQYARQQERQSRPRTYSQQQQQQRQRQQRQQQQQQRQQQQRQRYSRESYTQRQPRPPQQEQARYARQSYERPRRGQPQVQPVRQVQPVPVPQGDYVSAYPRSRYDYGRGAAAGRHISIPKKKRSRRRIVIPIIAIAVLLVLVGGAFAYAHSLPITVTLNDEEFELTGWHKTIGAVIDESGLDPKPGDLVAVDGSVLEAGQGEPFEATINDKVTSNSSAGVRSRDVIEINDGDPIEEPADVVEKPVDYEVEIEGTGAIHLMEGTGKDGVKEVKTGQISGLTSEEVTQEPDNVVCHEVSPDVGDDKVIALTFDDGPSEEYTSEILDVLKANDAKATFFTIGTCIDDNDDGVSLVKRAAAAGNQICTHTYDHAAGDGQGTNLSFMTDTEQVEEVEKGFRCIDSALGYDVPRIMRAPGGNLTEDVVANVHSLVEADIGWNIDTEDWTKPGVSAIMEQIKNASPGEVVLMHDGGGDRSQTVEALQNALPILKSKGYTFVTIDELMEYDMS